MWIVGILESGAFRPLAGAPAFAAEAPAAAWASRELAANRIPLVPVQELVTWRPAEWEIPMVRRAS